MYIVCMSKYMASPHPYLGLDVYGPYMDNMGRFCIKLRDRRSGKASTMTVARYVLSVGLGRVLLPTEDADHIDGDGLNDSIENLQVISSTLNASKGKGNKTHKCLVFTCPVCTRSVISERRRPTAALLARPICCSRECSRLLQIRSNGYKDSTVMAQAYAVCSPTYQDQPHRHQCHNVVGQVVSSVSTDLQSVLDFLVRKDTDRPSGDFGLCSCGVRLANSRQKHCSVACSRTAQASSRLYTKPTQDELKELLDLKSSWVSLGRRYGVSDNAVRKWARSYGLL